MELRNFFFDCLEARDASGFEECVHEDFIYVRETEMFTRDEFRAEVIEEFVQGVMTSSGLQVLFENEKIIILDTNIVRGDIKAKITLSCLKKDGKLWRQMMTMDVL
ncbi:MAG: hypothetical protein VXY13_05500 [Pseudomonadota bacterium]|nr:hypothetical protein [Pseudomonadota bacterium]|tara:strand:- start:584 stop:901 length:318 start_codon:yes stop_codon:yes gene_type:complete